jgi:hypothetical protein
MGMVACGAGDSYSQSCLHAVYTQDGSHFGGGIDGLLVMKLCCLNKLDCGQTDRRAGHS